MNETSLARQSVKARRKIKDEYQQQKQFAEVDEFNLEFGSSIHSPDSANDMEDILCPTFDSYDKSPRISIEDHTSGTNTSNDGEDDSAADSIIRRVEEEIAAARLAAGYRSPSQEDHIGISCSEQDDADMEHILNTDSFNVGNSHTGSGSMPSSEGSSKNRALEMINEEFKQSNNNVTGNAKSLRAGKLKKNMKGSPPEDIYFSGEEWQREDGKPFDEPAGEEKKVDFPENQPESSYSKLEKMQAIMAPASPPRAISPPLTERPVSPNSPTQENSQDSPSQLSTPVRASPALAIDLKDATSPLARLNPKTSPKNSQHRSPGRIPPSPPTRSPTGKVSTIKQSESPDNDMSKPSTSMPTPPRNRDPDGDYTSAPTPPRINTRSANKLKEVASPKMARTRELLDSLKEQRESINRRSVPVYTRANKAREVMRSSRNSPRFSPVNKLTRFSGSDLDDSSVKRKPSLIHEENPVDYKIRFRNPFPTIKPPNIRRDVDAILRDHTLGVPEMAVRWVKPKKDLKHLIVAAMGTSLPRRSNACGALKVLTRHPKNQLMLARTDGFLAALTFAATQSVLGQDHDLALDARTRAVTCLMNVCAPKDNRVIVFKHPGVIECLLKVMHSDAGEGRAVATAALAFLAKSASCREGLAQEEGLIDVLSKVMFGAATYVSDEAKILRESPSSRKKMDDSVSEFSPHSSGIQDDDGSTTVSNASSEPHSPPSEIKPNRDQIPEVNSIRNQTEERQDEFVAQARFNACAALLHLSKQCAVSPYLCESDEFLFSLLHVAREVTNPIHTKCLEMICNLTRFRSNNARLSSYDGMIETLVSAAKSTISEDRVSALRALQNMSADPDSKPMLATTPVLNLLTSCAMRKDPIEKEVSVAVMYNITTEPSAVAAITNTKNVIATLVHLAHSPDSTSSVRLLACEALATVSLWLQTLAGTGSVPEDIPNVPLPSQKTTGWERWD